MGSGNGDPPAGAKKSHSSDKSNPSPFVDTWGGYTWDQEAGQWFYDDNHERHPPSHYEARSPTRPPFDGHEPLTDDSGMHYSAPDERGHINPSDEYARYRSNSPESLSAYWSPEMPLHEVQNTKKSRSMSPNPERVEPEPKREHILWTPAEDQRLVLSIKEGRLTWAQISTQVGSRDEASCKDRWNYIKSDNPDVHHVNSRHVERYSDMDASSSRPKDGASS